MNFKKIWKSLFKYSFFFSFSSSNLQWSKGIINSQFWQRKNKRKRKEILVKKKKNQLWFHKKVIHWRVAKRDCQEPWLLVISFSIHSHSSVLTLIPASSTFTPKIRLCLIHPTHLIKILPPSLWNKPLPHVISPPPTSLGCRILHRIHGVNMLPFLSDMLPFLSNPSTTLLKTTPRVC